MFTVARRILRVQVVLDKVEWREDEIVDADLQSLDFRQCQVVEVERVGYGEEEQRGNSSQREQQDTEIKVDECYRTTAHAA